MSVPTILALDLATSTGWALLKNGTTRSGSVSFPVARGESPGARFRRFRAWLLGRVAAERPEVIAFERPMAVKSGAAAQVLYGLSAVVLEVAEGAGIDTLTVAPSVLKKHATGRGNADKRAMTTAAAIRWKRPGLDQDDEADALWVLDWAQGQLGAGGES